MEKYSALVSQFIGNRDKLVILQADHTPIWLRLGSRKGLYADWEKGPEIEVHRSCKRSDTAKTAEVTRAAQMTVEKEDEIEEIMRLRR